MVTSFLSCKFQNLTPFSLPILFFPLCTVVLLVKTRKSAQLGELFSIVFYYLLAKFLLQDFRVFVSFPAESGYLVVDLLLLMVGFFFVCVVNLWTPDQDLLVGL